MSILSNKTALVTGGSRGIGAAIVKRLAQDGANVAFTYSTSPDPAEALVAELTASSRRVKAYRADAADTERAAGLIDEVAREFAGLDILVNNAGIFTTGVIGEMDMTEYHRVMQINVAGIFALTTAAIKVMKPGGRIINISSCLGERATMPGISVYTASKFAVSGFSRAWAKDLGEKGILVNAVQPGPINTLMNPEDSEYSPVMKAQTALGRFGKPEEVAGVVAFLAGPDAAYVTGATINVDGGWNA